ncbi:hypothetical protein PUN28_000305 [Cardiocondyla obscurior]|uniref:Secreted protein n=1 Tax=Cardiocondyla obscurior TaxID=286306 RepID=A0AAW2GYS4_9HYME
MKNILTGSIVCFFFFSFFLYILQSSLIIDHSRYSSWLINVNVNRSLSSVSSDSFSSRSRRCGRLERIFACAGLRMSWPCRFFRTCCIRTCRRLCSSFAHLWIFCTAIRQLRAGSTRRKENKIERKKKRRHNKYVYYLRLHFRQDFSYLQGNILISLNNDDIANFDLF